MQDERLLARVIADTAARVDRLLELAREAGGARHFLEHGHDDLSPRERIRLHALVELRKRQATLVAPRPKLLDQRAVVAWSKTTLGPLLREELWLIALDLGLRVRGVRLLARGAGNRLLLSPRDCLEEVLRLRGKAFILLHNHPSGEPTPSPEDRAFTEKVRAAAELVGVPLVDHLVVTEDDARSVLVE